MFNLIPVLGIHVFLLMEFALYKYKAKIVKAGIY